ncbi:hypothetical protein U1Q18_035531 [Sarracenia purpurea var. burkii]
MGGDQKGGGGSPLSNPVAAGRYKGHSINWGECKGCHYWASGGRAVADLQRSRERKGFFLRRRRQRRKTAGKVGSAARKVHKT